MREGVLLAMKRYRWHMATDVACMVDMDDGQACGRPVSRVLVWFFPDLILAEASDDADEARMLATCDWSDHADKLRRAEADMAEGRWVP